jgi:hypothetical protein
LRTSFPVQFAPDFRCIGAGRITSLRDELFTDSTGHPLQVATWQLVEDAATYRERVPLGNLLILNTCRN